jgi:hypothetical protein
MAVQVALAAVQTVTDVVAAIASINDMGKRRLYEQNLGLLTFDQKEKLERLMMQAGSEQARQQILAQTLGSSNVARIDGLAKVQAEKEKTKKTVLVVSIIGGVVLIGALIFLVKRR